VFDDERVDNMKKHLLTNNKNGGILDRKSKAFTLIELLAIIVILAIIAVITVPIILNIIENSRMGAATDSAYGYKDSINKYYLGRLSQESNYNMPDGTYTVNSENGYLVGTETLAIEISGQKPSGGSLTIEKNSVKQGCLQFGDYAVTFTNGKISNTVKGECTESNQTTTSAITFVNRQIEGQITTGDEVAIETEHFYVVSSNAEKTVLLSKYNLKVGNIFDSSWTKTGEYANTDVGYGLQSSDSKGWVDGATSYNGTVAFSGTNYWVDGSNNLLSTYGTSYPANVYAEEKDASTGNGYSVAYYVEHYVAALKDQYGLPSSASGRLLTLNEAITLGCDEETANCPNLSTENNNWISSTSYWLGSAYGGSNLWDVYSDGGFNHLDYFGDDGIIGVRPVIEISTSEL
jgi:type IV pilus assembly protein PilA